MARRHDADVIAAIGKHRKFVASIWPGPHFTVKTGRIEDSAILIANIANTPVEYDPA
jgi:hypothetical protein